MKLEKDKSIMQGKGEWDEAEHPRDEDGKFTNKGSGASSSHNSAIKESKPQRKSKSFEQQVDEVLNGTYKGTHVVMSEETPKIFQDIGVPNLPLLMTSKHAYLAINKEGKYVGDNDHYHDLGKELFLAIPKLMQSPMMILQSNRAKDELVVVLNWFDKDKNILIVPMKIKGQGNMNAIRIEANIAKTAYGRNNFKSYINKNFTQNDILAVHNKKIRNYSP